MGFVSHSIFPYHITAYNSLLLNTVFFPNASHHIFPYRFTQYFFLPHHIKYFLTTSHSIFSYHITSYISQRFNTIFFLIEYHRIFPSSIALYFTLRYRTTFGDCGFSGPHSFHQLSHHMEPRASNRTAPKVSYLTFFNKRTTQEHSNCELTPTVHLPTLVWTLSLFLCSVEDVHFFETMNICELQCWCFLLNVIVCVCERVGVQVGAF